MNREWDIKRQARIAQRSTWLRENGEAIIAALRGLLDDTQHQHHNCGERDCPVAVAKRLVKQCPPTPRATRK